MDIGRYFDVLKIFQYIKMDMSSILIKSIIQLSLGEGALLLQYLFLFITSGVVLK